MFSVKWITRQLPIKINNIKHHKMKINIVLGRLPCALLSLKTNGCPICQGYAGCQLPGSKQCPALPQSSRAHFSEDRAKLVGPPPVWEQPDGKANHIVVPTVLGPAQLRWAFGALSVQK